MTYKKKEIDGRWETDEEVIARLNTHTCGYCGSQLRYRGPTRNVTGAGKNSLKAARQTICDQ